MTEFPRGMGKVAPRALALAGYDTLESVADVTDKELLDRFAAHLDGA